VGRLRWSSRKTVEECLSIDTIWLGRNGFFQGYKAGGIEWKNRMGEVTSSIWVKVSTYEDFEGPFVSLTYTHTILQDHEKTEVDYQIGLKTTPCHFGGIRYWFICPLSVKDAPCRQRVGKLFLPPGCKYFGCKRCYNLTYQCQKEHDKRVDALLRNPEMLFSQVGDRSIENSILRLKALSRIKGI